MNNILYFLCISVLIAVLASWLIDLIVDRIVKRIREENREENREFKNNVIDYIKYELTDKDCNTEKDKKRHELNERLNNE